jgi:hypothetical protein
MVETDFLDETLVPKVNGAEEAFSSFPYLPFQPVKQSVV